MIGRPSRVQINQSDDIQDLLYITNSTSAVQCLYKKNDDKRETIVEIVGRLNFGRKKWSKKTQESQSIFVALLQNDPEASRAMVKILTEEKNLESHVRTLVEKILLRFPYKE